MCDLGQSPVSPPLGGAVPPGGLSSSVAALAAIRAGLAYLNTADAGSMSSAEQAECLRALERAGFED